jgi:ATP-dependent DNA ligase
MPTVESHVRLVEHVKARGVDFFRVACEHDLEGIVAKWRGGAYQSGPRTSWLKIRNPEYSQWENRRELFEARRDNASRRARWVRPGLALV